MRGVTSNPSIFEQAIGKSDEYDQAIERVLERHDRSAGEIFEGLAVEDIRQATDVLRPIFDATHGGDGFVSLEVSLYLATNTKDTIAEAKRLWRRIDRKNLMIKVPATSEGLPAIHDLVPEQIKALEDDLLLAKTLFIVSSKSGDTTEPNTRQDPKISPDVSWRGDYRRQVFGAVAVRPCAGGDRGARCHAACGIVANHDALMRSRWAAMQNPGVELGITLGLSAARRRDKVTILTSPRIAAFGAWAEHPFAESTGKQGKGLIPITG